MELFEQTLPHGIRLSCRASGAIDAPQRVMFLHGFPEGAFIWDQVMQRIVNKVGRRVDQTTPLADARLKDGSRVNVIVPPLSLRGTAISIRKFSEKPITIGSAAA